jgi:hypothetical protein
MGSGDGKDVPSQSNRRLPIQGEHLLHLPRQSASNGLNRSSLAAGGDITAYVQTSWPTLAR